MIKINKISKKRKILIDKWIYKCKKNIHEEIICYKTRWCVRDFEQLKSFNYYKTFVSMIKFMNYKIIFVIIVVNDWNIEQMNVKTVFLYEIVNEEIYVKIFHDYITNKFLMCCLRKALYEFKQTFRVWFETFDKFLKKLNFLFFNADQSVFCDEKFILIIYVNDLFIINFNK